MSEESRSPGSVPLAAVPGLSKGLLIAGYRLEREIGRGGMAVVFQAADERLGRPVALKILSPALAEDQAFRERFIRESRAAAAVDDPHIVPVFGAGEADGVLFIAMRYVPGGDARTLVRREGPLPADRAAAVISAVAAALDAAHATGLVHRDVKPANMLIDVRPGRPDHVYLSDFGLSKRSLSSSGLTGSGQFLGTVDYCAPEQIEGKTVDGRADQYSLACAVFELLTGAPPFQRDQATAMIWAHMSQPPPLLTARQPDLPASVDPVLTRAMAKAPGDRFGSCQEFSDALREALGIPAYHSGHAIAPGGHAATEVAWPAGHDGQRESPTLPVTAAVTYQQHDRAGIASGETGPARRAWQRDWTTWALILALPGALTGIAIGRPGTAGMAIGGPLFVLSVLGIPIGLIAKFDLWLRDRRTKQTAQRGISGPPGS